MIFLKLKKTNKMNSNLMTGFNGQNGKTLVNNTQSNELCVVENFQVEYASSAGAMVLSVENPSYSHRGTDFAFWKTELGPSPANINDWFHIHTSGHSTTIHGLKPGVVYPFAAAYYGSDKKVPMWSDIVTKTVGD